MRSLLDIPEDALDAVMATAYQLYQASRYPVVEVLCRGLIAAETSPKVVDVAPTHRGRPDDQQCQQGEGEAKQLQPARDRNLHRS